MGSMMRLATLTLVLLACGGAHAAAGDLESTLFDEVDADLAQAREQDVPMLAPDAFERAEDAYEDARRHFERGRSLDRIRSSIIDARTQLNKANETAALARVTFSEMLTARGNAISAEAPAYAEDRFDDAEGDFERAVETLERGRTDRAQERAADAAEQFRQAELEAIQSAILNDVRTLMEQAEDEDVDRYAPRTLASARSSLTAAENALAFDRYDTDRPRLLAQQAQEQINHALFLTRVLEDLDDDEITAEELMLGIESPIVDIATALNLSVDLSSGIEDTTSAILRKIRQRQRALSEAELAVAERDERIASLEQSLGGATQETVALNTLLAEQQERRARFDRVESMFGNDEAVVLRAGNEVILRLVGLTFASGSATIGDDDSPLLHKVLDAVDVFPDAVVTVEGHTDSFGSVDNNLNLSQRRAESVQRFLLEHSDLSRNRVAARGYGEANPIANNETEIGRTRNRRIDLVITHGG